VAVVVSVIVGAFIATLGLVAHAARRSTSTLQVAPAQVASSTTARLPRAWIACSTPPRSSWNVPLLDAFVEHPSSCLLVDTYTIVAGGARLTGIRWSRWGASDATASALWRPFDSMRPLKVTLAADPRRLAWCQGARYYTALTMKWNGRPLQRLALLPTPCEPRVRPDDG
jgi:hypothetical protein